jgi:hypothetical protein
MVLFQDGVELEGREGVFDVKTGSKRAASSGKGREASGLGW